MDRVTFLYGDPESAMLLARKDVYAWPRTNITYQS
jgi:hypothetical protein